MAVFVQENEDGGEAAKRPEDDSGAAPAARKRSVGMLLREARQGFGRDLPQIGAALRIRSVYLQAIEEGRYEDLPGPTYVIGFIRTYADYLGLDGAEMVRRFKAEAEGLDLKRDLSFPVPLTERSVPGGTILLLALILAVCGYGIWYYLSSSERTRPERVSAVPATLLPPPALTTSAPPAPLEPSHPTEANAALPVPLVPVAPPAPVIAAAPAPPAAAAPAPAVASLPAAPEQRAAPSDLSHVFGVTNGPARVVIRATADSWIQVRDAGQNLIFTRLMRAGEVYRVPDRSGLSMRTGNAGGLEISVDGRPAPSLGPAGILRRNVLLDPQRLAAGDAVVE